MKQKTATDWLAQSRFNLLVDYYTEVQFRPYGSDATRENTVPWLRKLDLGYVCIYAKGHSGYTSWPSSLKTQHNMLPKDMCRFFREVTREANTKLVLYYSGLADGIAGLRHPEWRMLLPNGSPHEWFTDWKFFVGHALCPLSAYWDEWVAIHLRELIENYQPDGFWVDGDWMGPCYCPRCQKQVERYTGLSGPWSEVEKRPDLAAAYARGWTRVAHDWRTRFCRLIKSLKPDCVYSAGNVSLRREFAAPFDWRSGDFFSPGHFWLHDIARMMRWYGTMDVPYDAYVCDTSFTHVRKHVRSRSKTLDRMLQEAATVAVNGGAVGYWTYPTATGAFVPSRMEKACRVREFIREREDVFRDSRSARWTAILASDLAQPTFGNRGTEGAHKAMAALHRSPDVMDETGLTSRTPYDLIVLPEQPDLDAATAKRLEAFVRAGGKLLSSGVSIQSAHLQRMLGVKSVRTAEVNDGHVLLKAGGEPTGVDSAWDKLELAGGRELYPLYLSQDQFNPECRNIANNWPMHGQVDEEHPAPAGFAAAVWRKLGRGAFVHITTDIFARYVSLGDPQMLRWLREIVEVLQPQPLFRTDAPSWVDVSLRCKGDTLLIHLVNHNPGREISRLNTDDTWVDEIPELAPFTCELRCATAPKQVVEDPGRKPLPHTFRQGKLRVQFPRLHIHGCIAVTPWKAPR